MIELVPMSGGRHRILTPKCCVFKQKQDVILDRSRTTDNVKKCNIYTNLKVSGVDEIIWT
jgi:hypothetical protein